MIGRAGVGVDNIDVEKASERGILVINTPGQYNSAAEHTMALMMAIARNIFGLGFFKKGQWKRSKFVGLNFSKTLGIFFGSH